MVFSSLSFIFGFMPAFFILYYLTPNRFRNVTLLIGSLVFYAVGTKDIPSYFFLLVLSLVINLWLGQKIRYSRRRKKGWLLAGLLYNFGILFVFKYLGFFSETIHHLFGVSLPTIDFILPPGISFFTFQVVSYLADVYRGADYRTGSYLQVGTYLCMFPQLIAGPIITYRQVESQMQERKHSWVLFDNGLREFCIGLALKVILANQIGNLWKDVTTIGYESISTPLAWMGILAFSFQLYFDFYGYSLMATGLGQMLGMNFPRNFFYPYVACSMTEFWRRWHITLSQWFRDYVYIPLGGSRCGTFRTFRNLFVVWLCTGFWHGASWNFILWGLLLFILIMIEKLGWKDIAERSPLLGHLYMLLAIPLTWMVFAITDLNQIKVYFCRLFPFFGVGGEFVYARDYLKYGRTYGVLLLLCFLFCTPLPRRFYKKYSRSIPVTLALFAVFWASIYCLYIGLNDPFLYFRF